MKFGSKAETLQSLEGKLTVADIPPLACFSVGQWRETPGIVLKKLHRQFAGQEVAVRSSALGEDGVNASQAGRYLSLLGIPTDDMERLHAAINRVIASYGDGDANHQVLVQKQIQPVRLAGVLFTSDLDTLSPYYVLSYDDQLGSTDGVTSGGMSEFTTRVRFKRAEIPIPEPWLQRLIETADELEKRFAFEHLDIEFAVDDQDRLHLLQVRPMVVGSKHPPVPIDRLEGYLNKIRGRIEKLNLPHPDLVGSRTILGNMPDWNPAEIIGTNPRPLALSLYKELITDSIWAYQRDNYGYRNMRGFPLLIALFGKPYIDVRVTFNSFIPKEIDDKLAYKLVDYYLDRFTRQPSDHDKVEFKILYTCYYPGLGQRIKKLLDHGFSEDELDRIKFGLLKVTNGIIHSKDGHFQRDLAKVEHLERRYGEVMEGPMSQVEKLYWLMEDCKRYGTLPFAGLARAGFIAVQFLDAFVAMGVCSEEERSAYMRTLKTVSRDLADDVRLLRTGGLSTADFLARYGHLRPGTYNILSKRYDEAFEIYFPSLTEPGAGGIGANEGSDPEKEFSFSQPQREHIAHLLVTNGLDVSVDHLLAFIRRAIEGREYGKFVFTRHLSAVLSLLEEIGQPHGLNADELSYLDIQVVLDLYASLGEQGLGERLRDNIARNKRSFNHSQAIDLPPVIFRPEDIYDFCLNGSEPNFITLSRVQGATVTEPELLESDLQGKIVCISSADPGYDWIFSRNIGGLITQYGGCNSHMAIRAAELGLPSVIGCGKRYFDNWSRASLLELNCSEKTVMVLN